MSPALNDDGWSPKDIMFHIGAWQAEAGRQFERMLAGTFERPRIDVEAVNAEWLELSRGLDLKTAEAELRSSHTRMLQEFAWLPAVTPDAEEWFTEAGELHYGEHLPALHDFVERLSA